MYLQLYNCYQICKSLNIIKFDGWSLCFLFIYQFFNPAWFRNLNCKVIFSMDIEYRCSGNRIKFSVRSQWTSCSVSSPLIWHNLDIGPGHTFCLYFWAQIKLLRLLFNFLTQKKVDFVWVHRLVLLGLIVPLGKFYMSLIRAMNFMFQAFDRSKKSPQLPHQLEEQGAQIW